MGLFNFFSRSVSPTVDQVQSEPRAQVSAEERALDLKDPKDWETIINPFGRKIVVSHRAAQKLSPWFACITTRAKDIAALPQHVYRRSGKRKEIAFDSDQYFLLHTEANDEVSAYEFKYHLKAYKFSYGDGFGFIERNPRTGRPIAYHLRKPWEMLPFREGNDRRNPLLYKDYITGEVLDPYDVIHDKNGIGEGDRGVSLMGLAKESIRQGLGADQFASRFVENGTHLSGWAEFPQWFKEGQADKFKEQVKSKVSGVDNTGDILVLQGGAKYHQLGMKLSDAEWIMSRNFTVNEICRWMDIPPSRIYASKESTNYEHEMLKYKTFSILPELVQLEQEFDRKVFQFIEDGSLYLKNEIKGFMRADLKSQNEYYKTGLFYGFLQKDEIRELEDMNPLPDGLGGRTFTQGSMIPDDRFNEYLDAIIAGKLKAIQSDNSEDQKKQLNGSAHIGAPAGEFTAGVRPN